MKAAGRQELRINPAHRNRMGAFHGSNEWLHLSRSSLIDIVFLPVVFAFQRFQTFGQLAGLVKLGLLLCLLELVGVGIVRFERFQQSLLLRRVGLLADMLDTAFEGEACLVCTALL